MVLRLSREPLWRAIFGWGDFPARTTRPAPPDSRPGPGHRERHATLEPIPGRERPFDDFQTTLARIIQTGSNKEASGCV